MEKILKEMTCILYATFRFLCEKLNPFFNLRRLIYVEKSVAMSIVRFGTRDGLCMVGKIYAKCIILGLIRKFYKTGEITIAKDFCSNSK